jgi:hypothetical protein
VRRRADILTEAGLRSAAADRAEGLFEFLCGQLPEIANGLTT